MVCEMTGGRGAARVPVAAFDVDGTLTTRDSVVPFLVLVAGRRPLVTGLRRHLPRLSGALARRDRDTLRAVATLVAFRDRPVGDVVRAAQVHAETIRRDRLRSDVVAVLAAHRAAGHRVVLVSASYEDYLVPLGERLGVDAVLGSRLEIDGDRCTGRLDGPNCRGPEKVRRLDAWLGQQALARDDVELWAYGDSPGDRELLDWADHPTWVADRVASVAPVPTEVPD